jgi:HD-GYP domain-containing protein (c-di-GMP phosphodiesterase class II)/DNA-binding CsgD family transcriptional regulator
MDANRPASDLPPGRLRTADLMAALSLASDMAVGLPAEHAVRSCYIGMHVADQMRLPAHQQVDVYYAQLLMDAGCTAWTSQLAGAILSDEIAARRDMVFHRNTRDPVDVFGWLRSYVAPGAPLPRRVRYSLQFALEGREFVREGFRNTCEVAQRFALRLGMSQAVQDALLSVFEQWDGGGPGGRRGDDIPLTSRIVFATSFFEALHQFGGQQAALDLARRKRGTAFDPAVVDAFLSVAQKSGFWAGLEQESLWTTVLELEPSSPRQFFREEQLEDVALSFADFADLKSPFSAGHSRRVGDLAQAIAHRLRLSNSQTRTIRQAALMHDVGLAAVPSFTLEKPRENLSQSEQEMLRLHPYHAERIFARVSALDPVVPLVASHHERMDGGGYYRGLSGEQIPVGARVIAVADAFDELTHETPDHTAVDPELALAKLSDKSHAGLWSDAVRALADDLGASGLPPARRSAVLPAGLTGREVEILRMLARGMSRRQIADELVLSQHTVRHHLEHIYSKVGVGTRVAAALFALEHDLIR